WRDHRPMPSPDASSLLVSQEGPVLLLTMNRPERRNALSLDMIGRLADAWDLAQADDAIRCVILTGAAPNYCVGGDMSSGWMAAGYKAQSDAEQRVIDDPSRIGRGLPLCSWLPKQSL